MNTFYSFMGWLGCVGWGAFVGSLDTSLIQIGSLALVGAIVITMLAEIAGRPA